jgi:hypothetical protein
MSYEISYNFFITKFFSGDLDYEEIYSNS